MSTDGSADLHYYRNGKQKYRRVSIGWLIRHSKECYSLDLYKTGDRDRGLIMAYGKGPNSPREWSFYAVFPEYDKAAQWIKRPSLANVNG